MNRCATSSELDNLRGTGPTLAVAVDHHYQQYHRHQERLDYPEEEHEEARGQAGKGNDCTESPDHFSDGELSFHRLPRHITIRESKLDGVSGVGRWRPVSGCKTCLEKNA